MARIFLVSRLIMTLCLLFSASPALAQTYSSTEVEAINNILLHNDADHGYLAGKGWQIDKPASWVNPVPKMDQEFNLIEENGLIIGLNLSSCQLSGEIDLSGLKALKTLKLHRNQLTSLKGLEKLKNLELLWAEENRLSNVGDLSGLTSLSELNLESNLIDRISINNLKSLKELNLAGNKLTDLGDLSGLEELIVLDAGYNSLTELPGLSQLKNLKYLMIGGNKLTLSASFQKLPKYIQSLGLTADQLVLFDLSTEALPELSRLKVEDLSEYHMLDLHSRPLQELQLGGRIGADQIINPGSIENLHILENSSFFMVELKSLLERLKPSQSFSAGRQSVLLGDVAGGLLIGQPYSLKDFSPRLADELGAVGGRASLHLYDGNAGRSSLEAATFDFGRGGPLSVQTVKVLKFDGDKVTFNAPGIYYLSIRSKSLRPASDHEINNYGFYQEDEIAYEDPIRVESPDDTNNNR